MHRRYTPLVPFFVLFLSMPGATTSASPREGDCQTARRAEELARRHGLPLEHFRALTEAACARRDRTDSDCDELAVMALMARIQGDPKELRRKVAKQRRVACALPQAAPATSWSWPNGQSARRRDGGWGWPNGQTARRPDGWRGWPNGQTARSTSGSWYYPGGVSALSADGRWHDPRGSSAELRELVSRACDARPAACRGLDLASEPDPELRTLRIIGLLWSALR